MISESTRQKLRAAREGKADPEPTRLKKSVGLERARAIRAQQLDEEKGQSMTFGSHIHALRRARGMTQRALAHLIDSDETYISAIENGRKIPTEPLIGRLAIALKASRVDLLIRAGHLPSALHQTALENRYARQLVRVLTEQPLPDLVYRQMLYLAKKAKEQEQPA